MIGDELAQHRHEHVDGVRGLSFLVRQAPPAERVVRAVHLRAAVDEEESRAGHAGRSKAWQGYHWESCHCDSRRRLAHAPSCCCAMLAGVGVRGRRASDGSASSTKKRSTWTSTARRRSTSTRRWRRSSRCAARPAGRSAGPRRPRSGARVLHGAGQPGDARQPVAARRPAVRARLRSTSTTSGKLPALAPFAWSSYRLERQGGRARVPSGAAPGGRAATWATWAGRATRSSRSACTCPARSRFTTRRPAQERGNILSWEQPLAERAAGTPAGDGVSDGAAVDSVLDAAAVRGDDRGGGLCVRRRHLVRS